MITVLLTSLAVIVVVMVALWLASIRLGDVSIIDPFWGLGFVLLSVTSFLVAQPHTPRPWLILALVTVWGLRLFFYLLWRNWGKGEDSRYAAMRAARGDSFRLSSLWIVFLLQAGLLWLVAFPIQIAISIDSSRAWNAWDAIGVVMWSIGLFFETVGDIQLARFKRDERNRGKVLDRGLWRYTRHPNYFGDFCVWWGIYFLSASGGAWWTIFSPILMSLLLLRVSGVTLLERTIEERRPAYREYKRRTSSFFPWPPRSPT